MIKTGNRFWVYVVFPSRDRYLMWVVCFFSWICAFCFGWCGFSLLFCCFVLFVCCCLMFERVGIERKVGEKMKDDEELERLLGEIPHATSNNHHHQHQQDDTSGNHHHCVHGLNGGHGHGSFVSPQLRKLMWLTFTRLPQWGVWWLRKSENGG